MFDFHSWLGPLCRRIEIRKNNLVLCESFELRHPLCSLCARIIITQSIWLFVWGDLQKQRVYLVSATCIQKKKKLNIVTRSLSLITT